MKKETDKYIITRSSDELLKYEIRTKEGYRFKGKCLLGKYADELFEEEVDTTKYSCYNLRECKSLIRTIVEEV